MEFPVEYNVPPFRMTLNAFHVLEMADVLNVLKTSAKLRQQEERGHLVSAQHDLDDDIFVVSWSKDGPFEVYLRDEM